ncbi:hypothetical protein D3C75_747800 [compost metagenome]
MHPDLMGASALQLQLDLGCAGIHFLDHIAGQGRITFRRYDPPVRLHRVTVDRAIYVSARRSGNAMHPSVIPLVHRTGNHLLGNMLVAVWILCNNQHARGLLIQPVNGTEAVLLALLRPVIDNSIRQRIRIMPVGRMHDHPGCLVDDQQMLILIEDLKRNRLRQNVLRGLLLHADLYGISCADPDADVDPFSVQHNALFRHFEPGQQLAGYVHPLLQNSLKQPAVLRRRHLVGNW